MQNWAKTKWLWAVVLCAWVNLSTAQPHATNSNHMGLVVANKIDRLQWLTWVNEVRHKGCHCGTTYMKPVKPVQYDATLERAAFDHSADMYQNNYFNHVGLNGSNLRTRANAAGGRFGTICENIATGTYLTSKTAFYLWMKSPGHCRNIMNATVDVMAVGQSHNQYYTMMLGSGGKPIAAAQLGQPPAPQMLASTDVDFAVEHVTVPEAKPVSVQKIAPPAEITSNNNNAQDNQTKRMHFNTAEFRVFWLSTKHEIELGLKKAERDISRTTRRVNRKIKYKARAVKYKVKSWFR